jgi:hypothetical protein
MVIAAPGSSPWTAEPTTCALMSATLPATQTPLTPLSPRMIAAWLAALAVAAPLSLRERDVVRARSSAVACAVFGVLQLLALLRYGKAFACGSGAAESAS